MEAEERLPATQAKPDLNLSRKARGIAFKRQPYGIRDVADGSVEARQHHDFEKRLWREVLPQVGPSCIVEIAILMELIASGKEGALVVTPYGVVLASFYRRCDLALIETGALGKERNMNPPLIFGPTQCGDPVDHDLALPEREVPGIEQSTSDELSKEPLVSGKGGK